MSGTRSTGSLPDEGPDALRALAESPLNDTVHVTNHAKRPSSEASSNRAFQW